MKKSLEKVQHITVRNNFKGILTLNDDVPDRIANFIEAYFRFEVTNSKSSQKSQKRDFALFLEFLIRETGSDERLNWTPRLSRSFRDFLRKEVVDDKRRWSERSINRILAHLKTFSKWVHNLREFPLGDPTRKLKSLPVGNGLNIERAITKSERNRLLDAADIQIASSAFSKDRSRYTGKDKPRRKTNRAYRNRAIIYTLIETGMRRRAITQINLHDVDFEKRKITVEEKGEVLHSYNISREGIKAIQDYLDQERAGDNERWNSPSLFLAHTTNPYGNGTLTPNVINNIWNKICEKAGVTGKTPHSARHAMGKHIIEKTGNIAAVQRQLGHKNAAYSMQYSRITDDELDDVLNDRV